jgi:hypothetical protein
VPGRITDQLRRITREQGGAHGDPGDEGRAPSAGARRRGPWIALIVVLVVSGVGWVVVDRLMTMSKLQDCVMSGRKNCAPIEVDSAGK